MANLTFVKFQPVIAAVWNGKHNVGSDTLKIMLTNTEPLVTAAVKSDITEISAGNGYTAGGTTVEITSSSQTGGTFSLVSTNNETFTASGGAISEFQWAVLYNDTATNKDLLGYWDIGVKKNLSDTDSYTLNIAGQTLISAS